MIEAVTVSVCELFPGLMVITQIWGSVHKTLVPKSKETQLEGLEGTKSLSVLTFRHRASCILGQAFHYSPENAFYVFNQQIYLIIWYLLDRASLI